MCKFSESTFEDAIIELFTEDKKYQYACGYDIHRTSEDIILQEDFFAYLDNAYKSLICKEMAK